MTGQIADTVTTHRSDYGTVRLGRRDIDGLLLCAEHFGAPYDLLAAALGAQPARLRGIVARWRRAGYAATGRLGPGPAWCWLTPAHRRHTPHRRRPDHDPRTTDDTWQQRTPPTSETRDQPCISHSGQGIPVPRILPEARILPRNPGYSAPFIG